MLNGWKKNLYRMKFMKPQVYEKPQVRDLEDGLVLMEILEWKGTFDGIMDQLNHMASRKIFNLVGFEI